MNPLVSVIIPSYNRSNTIERAIDSVINQTYTNLEIIVVDDSSQDNTEEVLRKYTHIDNFKYIKLLENVGGAEARNIGVVESKGSFIAFQDSDDEWLLDKLEKQMRYFKDNDVDIVFSQIERITTSSNSIFPKNLLKESLNISKLLQLNYIGTPSAVIKKKCLSDVNGFDKTLPRLQDWDLFIRLSRNCKFYMIPEVLCIAYLQENSITNNSKALIKTLSIFNRKFSKDINKLTKKERSLIYEKYGSLLMNDNEIKEAKGYFIKGIKNNFMNLKLLSKLTLITIGGTKLYKLLQ